MGVLSPGALLDDHYVVQALLGQGANTEVYRAEHLNTRLPVAIKVLVGDHLYDRAAQRFRREAQAVAKLPPDAVIQILDNGETDDGLMYLVMEYVEGGTLRDLLDGHRRFRSTRSGYSGDAWPRPSARSMGTTWSMVT